MSAEFTETHGAVVFFVGDLACKMKKAVTFDFFDFSTPQLRRRALTRELELNRRIAPDVYLGVADFVGESDEIVDSMLLMKRMPDDRRLGALVVEGGLASSGVDSLDDQARTCLRATARTIAAFHASAASDPEISSAGEVGAVLSAWEANSTEMAEFVGELLDPAEFAQLDRARRYIEGRRPLFDSRIAADKIRDGHGDLLAGDIFCMPDGPRILDCIEFNDEFRWCDVVSDVAFLAMDLERLGRPDLASYFLADYHEFSGDAPPPSLVDHYVAYRAQIRSKVACLRQAQGGPDRDLARSEAAQLLRICTDHLDRARIRLVVVGGLPATGKSTLAAGISRARGWPVLRSDVIRKGLAGLAPTTPASAPVGEGIYRREMTELTYATMFDEASKLVSMGQSVILDATFADARHRQMASALAEATSTDLVELRCDCPRDLAARRAGARRGDASDAGESVAREMSQDPWPDSVTIDTTIDGLATALSAL